MPGLRSVAPTVPCGEVGAVAAGIGVTAPEAKLPPAAQPPKPRKGGLAAFFFRSRRHRLIAILAVAGTAIIAFALLGTTAVRQSAVSGSVGVCSSSMTERVARDILHEFSVQNRSLAEHFELRQIDCGARFLIALYDGRGRRSGAADPMSAEQRTRMSEGHSGRHVRMSQSIIGRDAVVAIVNPQNPVGQMSVEQLRKIVAGDLANWISLGGRSLPIVVYLPADSTDEARVVSAALMHGVTIGKSVVRVPSSADAVRAVVAANGSTAIGLVAFSAAVPGKVLALQEFPAPSILSIGDGRYPLSVAVTVASADDARYIPIRGLLAFASTDDAKAIAERAGIIREGGSP